MQTISIICAVAANGGIGSNGDLAFHISADLKRFKALTTGHTVVMGRKTLESLPKGVLPNRRNIVVTRNPQWFKEFSARTDKNMAGLEVASSIEEAIKMAEAAGETELFIIGGGQIYAAAMPLANRLDITEIDSEAPDADTFFPEITPSVWQLETPQDAQASQVSQAQEAHAWQLDEKSGVNYRFVTYRRR